MTRFHDSLILVAILLLATGLRLWGLNAPLWYDEIQTLDTHLRLDWSAFFASYELNHHYFHNLAAKLSIGWFGETNWAIRLPAMVFGVGSIWMAWILAKDLTAKRFAHVTALLLALSYHHIWFSQNARGYTELAFWGLAGTILFLRGLSKTNGSGLWLAYSFTLAATIFTHLTGAFLFAAHGLIWLGLIVTRRGTPIHLPLLSYLFGAILTLLVYLPLLPSLWETVTAVSATSAVDVMAEYQNPLWSLLEGLRTGLGRDGWIMTAAGLGVLIFMLLGTAYSGWTFFLLFVAHIGLTLVALTVLGMRIWPRFFFTDIAFALILIVPGVALVSDWLGRIMPKLLPPRRVWVLGVLAMAALSSALAYRNYTAPKQNLEGAVAYVAEHRAEGEEVYAITYSADLFNRHFGTDWNRLTTPTDLWHAMKVQGSGLYVVTFPQRAFRLFPGLRNDRNFEVLERFPGTLGDGRILILRRR